MTAQRQGLLLCLVAAAGLSTTGIFAKLAYESHASVTTVLAARFVLTSALLWLVVYRTGQPLLWLVVYRTGQPLPARRLLLVGLLLGLLGYGLQVALLFVSLERIDASLSSLLFYSYPAMVTAGALLLGRERASIRRGAALGISLVGVVLVFSGGAAHRDGLGVVLSLAAALTYAVLILIVDRIGSAVRPLVLSTLVPTGSAVTFVGGGLLLGNLQLSIEPEG